MNEVTISRKDIEELYGVKQNLITYRIQRGYYKIASDGNIMLDSVFAYVPRGKPYKIRRKNGKRPT